jgi:arylsulfatase B
MADDVGFGNVGFLRRGAGAPGEPGESLTPRLDALAARRGATAFESHYSHHMCSPSRGALLAGRYASRLGLQHGVLRVHRASNFLPPEVPLLPGLLRERGYRTHLVGKWHLGSAEWALTPLERGFDTFVGMLGANQDYYTHRTVHFGQGYDFWRGREPFVEAAGKYSTDVFADEAERIITEAGAEARSSAKEEAGAAAAPWFTLVSWQAAHTPFGPGPPASCLPNVQRPLSLFEQTVGCMDAAVGRVLDALEESGQADNTVVVFLSDNGGEARWGANAPLRGSKGTLWEGGVRTPALAYVPPQIAGAARGAPAEVGERLEGGGVVSAPPVHLVDWLPTLLSATGAAAPAGADLDGEDLWPLLTGSRREEPPSTPREILINVDTVPDAHVPPEKWSGYAGIRVGDMKLLLGDPGFPRARCPVKWASRFPVPGSKGDWVGLLLDAQGGCHRSARQRSPGIFPDPYGGSMLFNVSADPGETMDLAAALPGVVQDLTERLLVHKGRAVTAVNTDPAERVTDRRAHPSRNGGLFQPWLESDGAGGDAAQTSDTL